MLNKNHIYIENNIHTSEDAIKFLANKLFLDEKVTGEYEKALLDREKEYPTGIETGFVNIAIPHADYEQVKSSTLAVLVSESPIPFKKMEDPESETLVNIVIMLAISSPDGHLTVLSKLAGLFSRVDVLRKIYEEKDKNIIYEILEEEVFR